MKPKIRSHSFNITRRSLLKVGVSAFGLLATSGIGLAAICPSVATPRQTRGPFFPYDHVVSFPIREESGNAGSLIEANDHDLTRIKGKTGIATGQIIYFHGQLWHDSQENSQICQPLAGATVLLWQANFSGRYNHREDDSAQSRFPHPQTGDMIERVHDQHFQYWGKAITDAQGKFRFKTIMPGFYPAADDWYRPPHLHFSIRAKGYPEFVTQTYFSGKDLPNIELISDLNRKDWILQDSRMQPTQQEQVIVDYQRDPNRFPSDGLGGTCHFLLSS